MSSTSSNDARSAYRKFLAEENFAAACDSLQAALEQTPKTERPELAAEYHELATLHLRLEDAAAAELAARKSVELEMRHGPSPMESDRLAVYHVTLADALRAQGRLAEALPALDRGLALFAQHRTPDAARIAELRDVRNAIEKDRWREK